MNEHTHKTIEQQSVTPAQHHTVPGTPGTARFVDNRSEAIAQRKLREGMNSSPKSQDTAQLRKSIKEGPNDQAAPMQRKSNQTGLPDTLKSGIENLSGYAMDDVRVHYNSGKPAQLQAHAYAQGTDIHLAPGQEKHLPHEAWHVVQQKQGRVAPTRQLKSKVNINDDAGLEKEADVMGAKALLGRPVQRAALADAEVSGQTVQMERYEDLVGQYGGAANAGRVLVIEVNMAGSANPYLDPGDLERNATWTYNRADKRLAHSTRPTDNQQDYYREQIEFQGPGGPQTTGMGSRLKGGADRGSNSTKNLKKLVPQYVDEIVNRAPNEQWAKIVVIVTAHSRGAVAAYHVAHGIKYRHRNWHVELAQFDPVPGPGQKAKNKKGYRPNDSEMIPFGPIATPLDDHTVVYSVASGWLRGFTPMHLHTMKRLIITQEGHSAGLGKVYFYEGHEYEKSELNSLPRGVYVERALGNRGQLILNSTTSSDEAKRWYGEAIASSKYKSDLDRQKIIFNAIDSILW